MKKNILILSALFLSILGIAGTKEDLESAYEKYNSTQNVAQLQASLSEIIKHKPDEFTRRAKLELAKISSSNNDLVEAKKYLNEIINDKNTEKSTLEETYVNLYIIEKNSLEKAKISEKLIDLSPNAENYKLLVIKEYAAAKNTKKSDDLYKKYTAKLSKHDRIEFDKRLATLYNDAQMTKESKKIIDKLFKDKDNESKGAAKEITTIIAANDKRYDDALRYANEALVYLGETDKETNNLIYQIYKLKGDNNAALNHLIAVNGKDPSSEVYQEIIVFAENIGNEKVANETLISFRAAVDLENRKKINNVLARRIINEGGKLETALKYALNAVKEDGVKEANNTVAIIYASLNNKVEALKAIEQAIKDNVEGAQDVKNFINNNLK